METWGMIEAGRWNWLEWSAIALGAAVLCSGPLWRGAVAATHWLRSAWGTRSTSGAIRRAV